MFHVYKSVSAGIIYAIMERYVLGITNYQINMANGAITGTIIGGVDYIVAQYVNMNVIPSVHGLYEGKSLLHRIIEVPTASVLSYYVSRYAGYDLFKDQMYTKIGVILVADVLSEYVADYASGQTLHYFT